MVRTKYRSFKAIILTWLFMALLTGFAFIVGYYAKDQASFITFTAVGVLGVILIIFQMALDLR